MKHNIEKAEKHSILTLEEEKLDSTISPDIKSVFQQIYMEGPRNIIVDLSHVKYSDSSGLSALLVGNRIFTDQQGAFVLAGQCWLGFGLRRIGHLVWPPLGLGNS